MNVVKYVNDKIRNLVKAGLKVKTIDTNFIDVKFLGKEQQVLLIIPYGTHLNLPDNEILTILLQQEGHEDSLLGIPTDTENRDELEEKEVAYGIPTMTARIKFNKNDEIEINAKDNIIIIDDDGVKIEDKNGNDINMTTGKITFQGGKVEMLQ